MNVVRYPAFTGRKNQSQALALIKQTIDKHRSKFPPLPFKSPANNKEEMIQLLKGSPFPYLQNLGSEVEKEDAVLKAAFTQVSAANKKDLIFPIDLWKTVLPPIYVDTYKQYLDKQYNDKWESSDVLPLAKEYSAFLDYQLPKMAEQYKHYLGEYDKLLPEIKSLEARLLAIENNELSIETLLAENPDIAAEIGEELERGDWSVDGSGKEDPHAAQH